MECKVGYIRGHGFSALEELGHSRKESGKNVVWAHCWVNSRPRAGDGGTWCIKTIFIY